MRPVKKFLNSLRVEGGIVRENLSGGRIRSDKWHGLSLSFLRRGHDAEELRTTPPQEDHDHAHHHRARRGRLA